jgi:hypothetical protein
VCGRTARTVRREGRARVLLYPYHKSKGSDPFVSNQTYAVSRVHLKGSGTFNLLHLFGGFKFEVQHLVTAGEAGEMHYHPVPLIA